jgi:hypothetical protein
MLTATVGCRDRQIFGSLRQVVEAEQGGGLAEPQELTPNLVIGDFRHDDPPAGCQK